MRQREADTPAPAKRCLGRCGQVKPLTDYSTHATASDGRATRCRECLAAERRDHNAQARRSVFDHYGWSCACCGATDDLTIDHVNGDGTEHRRTLGHGRNCGGIFYLWLIAQGFPDRYQTMCLPCNSSKGGGPHCRLAHTPGMKRCTGPCGAIKPLGDFSVDKRCRDGRQGQCKMCRTSLKNRAR